MSTAMILHTRPGHTVHSACDHRPTTRTPADMRAWLSRYLQHRGHTSENALLVISELATNAVRYARAPLTISAHIDDDRLILTVTDRPHPNPAPLDLPDDEHGMGLAIVKALCAWLDDETDERQHTVTAAIPLGDPDLPGYLADDPGYPAI